MPVFNSTQFNIHWASTTAARGGTEKQLFLNLYQYPPPKACILVSEKWYLLIVLICISVSSVPSLSHVQLCNFTDCSTPRLPVITNSWRLLRLMPVESVMPSNHLILCRPLFPHPQSFSVTGSSPVSQLFTSGGQSIGASVSFIPVNSQGLIPLGLTCLISLLY